MFGMMGEVIMVEFFPYSYKEKERVSFLEWYDIWLTEILDKVPIVERDF